MNCHFGIDSINYAIDVPTLMVAWREMTFGLRGVSLVTSKVARSCGAKCADRSAGVGLEGADSVASDMFLTKAQ